VAVAGRAAVCSGHTTSFLLVGFNHVTNRQGQEVVYAFRHIIYLAIFAYLCHHRQTIINRIREMSHAQKYLNQVSVVAGSLDPKAIDAMAAALAKLREAGGRLFFIGAGGSAGNCGHAVNDFRKLCGIESYAPTDNVSELTARTNDEGWETVFAAWLITSKLSDNDGIFVFSVGGGDLERNVSPNIVRALELAKKRGAKVFGVVGRDGGFTKKVGDHVIIIPTVDPVLVTPHTEAFHAVVWHCLVSHPKLQQNSTKW
jgi:D-sedoheptulose 7-phosphate isomerase